MPWRGHESVPYGAPTTSEFPRFPGGDPVVVVAYGADDGVAWVWRGWVSRVRPAGVPGLPSFAETNLVAVLEETLTTAMGLPAPLDEPVGHYSPGVEPVRPGSSRPLFT